MHNTVSLNIMPFGAPKISDPAMDYDNPPLQMRIVVTCVLPHRCQEHRLAGPQMHIKKSRPWVLRARCPWMMMVTAARVVMLIKVYACLGRRILAEVYESGDFAVVVAVAVAFVVAFVCVGCCSCC
jgi:hypothetical protein